MNGETASLDDSRLVGDKATIEGRVVSAWLDSSDGAWRRAYQLQGEPRQDVENSFDFVLPTAAGDHYLELMEVAPLDAFGGSYEAVPPLRYAGQAADLVWERLLKKSVRYGGRKNPKLHLLLYSASTSTHLDDSVLWLLAYWFHTRPHVFASVIYFMMLDDAAGFSFPPLHPVAPRSFEGFDEHAARESWFLMLRPSHGSQTTDGRGWSIPLTGGCSEDEREPK